MIAPIMPDTETTLPCKIDVDLLNAVFHLGKSVPDRNQELLLSGGRGQFFAPKRLPTHGMKVDPNRQMRNLLLPPRSVVVLCKPVQNIRRVQNYICFRP